MISFSRSK